MPLRVKESLGMPLTIRKIDTRTMRFDELEAREVFADGAHHVFFKLAVAGSDGHNAVDLTAGELVRLSDDAMVQQTDAVLDIRG